MKLDNICSRFALLGLALAVTACKFGPDYQREELPLPAEFRGGSASENSIADLPWWKVFKNRELQNLLTDTYNNNRDLQSIIANVEAARQYVVVANAPLFPWVGYGAGISKGSNYSLGNPTPAMGNTSTPGSFQGNVSWELDIWGKTRRATESATAEYLATDEAQRNLMLSLMKQVANGYLSLLQKDDELRIMKEAVAQYSKAMGIFENRAEGGIDSKLPSTSAQAALSATRSQILRLENDVVSLENTLSALAGRMPGKIQRSGSISQIMHSVNIPAGIPAQILNRRPDVRQREQLLRSANAKIGVAIANYFPSISLTAGSGMITSDLEKVVGRSGSWGIGANLTGPIFQGGSLTAAEKIARQDFLSAKANYEQTVINALSEVSSTLYSRTKLNSIISQQKDAVTAYKTATDLSLDLFNSGVTTNYLDVLYAMQNQYPAEVALSQYQYQFASTIVTLYTALGGGWNQTHKQMMQGPKE